MSHTENIVQDILNAISDYYSESIFVTDGEGNVIFVNKIGAERLNSTPEKLIGRNVDSMVSEGLYGQSTTRKAIQTKRPFAARLFPDRKDSNVSKSVPILDEKGDVRMVITANMSPEHSKDWDTILSQEHEIAERLRRELDNLRSSQNVNIICESMQMKQVRYNLDIISPTLSSIVIVGESGTGKDLMARYIHAHSDRKNNAFISINCAAIPEPLLESELFGYEAGAFTGALSKGKIGLFEAADGGTLFLDEIGEMPLGLQSKLLNAIEDKAIRKVGGVKSIPVDVRIICATNANLDNMVHEHKFREDLYYRLSVFTVQLPPLRDRKDDIMPLAEHFLAEMNRKNGSHKYLSEVTRESMLKHNWPGNIRELRNVIERIFVVSYGDDLEFTPMPTFRLQENPYEAELASSKKEYGSLKEFVNDMEKAYIEKTLKECGGSMTKTSQKLGIDRTALYRKLKKLEN
ncbi:MAG: sigma 54-interacting transcriptional regulator [Clostridia bacterium]|nr:sigma 54-interacting transcriptional regulator [Clostridia bacterium]